MALRQSIEVRTDEQLLQAAVRKKFRPAYVTYDNLPVGANLTTLIIKTANKLTPAQLDTLEASVAGLAGIQVCKVLHQGPDGGIPTPPTGFQCNMTSELAIEFVQIPAP